jgi:hypothetical protein
MFRVAEHGANARRRKILVARGSFAYCVNGRRQKKGGRCGRPFSLRLFDSDQPPACASTSPMRSAHIGALALISTHRRRLTCSRFAML